MKKTFITMLLAILTLGATAQGADSLLQIENDAEIVLEGDSLIQPQFKGGLKGLEHFLRENVRYPQIAKEYDVEARVVMTFVVDVDGLVKEVGVKNCWLEPFDMSKFASEVEAEEKEQQLKQQFAWLFGKESTRVVRKMPKWTPGQCGGKNVRVKYSLPITFKSNTK